MQVLPSVKEAKPKVTVSKERGTVKVRVEYPTPERGTREYYDNTDDQSDE